MADDAGALLVRSGLVSTSALDEARSRADELGGTIGEHLVWANVITDDALTDFYKQRLLVPLVNPNTLARLPIRVVASIPQDMAIELRAVPVALDSDNNLTVAMSDPSDSNAVDEIAFFTGAYVVRAVATQMQIAWCLAHYYGHVTPLGQRLLQSTTNAAPTPVSAPRPRQKGLTGKVDAMRHRGIAPMTGPVNVQRPTSGEIPLPLEVAPMPAPAAPVKAVLTPEVELDTNPTIIPNRNAGAAIAAPVRSMFARDATPVSAEAAGLSASVVVPTALPTAKTIPEFLLDRKPAASVPQPVREADTPADGVPDKHPRPRSVSGEIRVPKPRAESIKPLVEEDPYTDEDEGPVITMEVDDDDAMPTIPDEDTSPRKVPARRRAVKSDPPELAARAGEVETAERRHTVVDEGPRIIISDELDDPKPDAAGEIQRVRAHRDSDASAPSRTIEVSDDESEGVVIHERVEPESTPILLDRTKPPSNPQALLPKPPVVPDDDDDDVVELAAKSATNKLRPVREAKRTQIGMGAIPAVTRAHRDTDAGIPEIVDDSPTQVTDTSPMEHAIKAALGEHDDNDDDDDVAEPPQPATDLGTLARPIHTPKWAEHEDLDDGWGPPGSTIPPPLLGAMPGTAKEDDDDAVPGRIPVSDVDSAPLIVAPPSPPEISRGAPRPETASTPVRALEDATSRMIEMIRTLDYAQSRDDVVGVMVQHLAETHRRAGFFMIKPVTPRGASELGVFSIEPRPATLPFATLRLDSPSTLQDVVGTRLPYRGPMHDNSSRQFLANVLGACPPEILLVPVAVRDRVVGVLFGDHRLRHTFDDQLAIAARAAGMALERVLKSKRGG
ncbi:MAG: hypothetical protein ACKV2T_02460 [Kofleriaceae bacterium]